jgi:hypothetical protein
MGMFAGIEEVTVKQRSRYVEPGEYIAKISAVKKGRTKQEEKSYFVVELEVEESTNPDFAAGDQVTWMTMVNKYKHYFLEEVKGFVATATDSRPDEVTEEVVEFVTGEDQPLVGKILKIQAWKETNANSGKSFTKTEFRLQR